MQYWEQSPRTVYHENNSTASFLTGHNQTRWESARPSPQTEPWTFGKQSGLMPLAQRPTLHKPLPDIGDERYQTSFAPRHQGKSRSLAMAVTELIAPDNTPRPFTAPASFNPVGHQAFGAAHYPSGNATYVPDGSESTVRARVCVFRSAGCDHAVPCLMAGLESVVTQYNGVPPDGWRALDKFADLTMVSCSPVISSTLNRAEIDRLSISGPRRTHRGAHRPLLHHLPCALSSACLLSRAPFCAPLLPLVGDVSRQPPQGRRILPHYNRPRGYA